jgi:acyl carrier protein
MSSAVRQTPQDSTAAFLADIREAFPEERRDLLVAFVREHVAAVLRRDPGEGPIGRRQSLMDLGLDSLMAVELRNRLTRGLKLVKQLPVSLIFDYPNIEAVAQHLDELLNDVQGAGRATGNAVANGAAEPSTARRDLTDVSDNEIEAMLLKKLDSRGSP